MTHREVLQEDVLECFCSADIVSSLNELHKLFANTGEDDIARLLTSVSLIRLFNVSLYWMFHLKGILNLSTFLSKVDSKYTIEMMLSLWKLKDDKLQRDIFDSIILHVFTDYCSPPMDRTSELGHSYRQKCYEVLDEVCMEYSSVNPVTLGRTDIERITAICGVITQSENTTEVQNFHTHILTRLFSSTFTYYTLPFEYSHTTATTAAPGTTARSQTPPLDEDLSASSICIHNFITCLVPEAGITAIERALREEYFTPFAMASWGILRHACGSSTCPLVCMLLPQSLTHTADTKALCTLDTALSIAMKLAGAAIANTNSSHFLRALCLVDIVGGPHQVAQFLTDICGQFGTPLPDTPDNSRTEERDKEVTTGARQCVESLKDFSHVCLSLCEAAGHMPRDSLRAVYQVIRNRREASVDCKEPADSFLQVSPTDCLLVMTGPASRILCCTVCCRVVLCFVHRAYTCYSTRKAVYLAENSRH